MQIQIFFIICILSVTRAVNNSSVDCTNEDIVTSIFNKPIPLTLNDTILVYENVSINRLISTANNEFDKNYIDARLEQDTQTGQTNLVIYATEHFASYAQEQTAVRITLKIVLGCGMGKERTLIFFQPIMEGNYFIPTFSRELYEITMPTPIFAGFDLAFFVEIAATDDDLTNNQIEFSSTDAAEKYHIIVGTNNDSTSADGKSYFASLRLERIYLALPEELTFDIMAKDHGSPPLNSTATVIVRADPNNSLPATPQFQHSNYKATLNIDLTMEPLQIKLAAGTDISQVSFIKTGADNNLFSIAITAEGVEAHLARALTYSHIQHKDYLELIIGVEHKNLAERRETAVIVLVPHMKEYFHFEKAVYEGFVDSAGNLQLDNIAFNSLAYNADIVFKLNEAALKYFTLQRVDNSLKLNLTADLDMEIWYNLSFVSLEIEATLENLSAVTTVILALPNRQTDGNVKPTEFQKPLYVGFINHKDELIMESIVLKVGNFSANEVIYTLSGNGSAHFDFIMRDNNIELFIKPMNMSEINDTVIMILTAESNNLKAHTAIVVKPAVHTATAGSRLFQSTWYRGRIELAAAERQLLHLAAITLKINYNVTDFKYSLNEAAAAFLAVIVDAQQNNVHLNMLRPLPALILNKKSQIILELKAVHAANASIYDTVPIFIELPKKECTESFPTSSLPIFDSSEYIFAAKPNQIGSLSQVSAIVPGSNATLHYSLSVVNEHLQKRLSINPTNGELLLLSYVSSGVYYFRINAENVVTFGRTSVDARLDVDSLLQCDDQHAAVAYSLIVKYIEEEREHLHILNTTMGHCQLNVTHMYPNDRAYVYIHERTRMLSTIAIDREDPIFANMSVPQIQVRLKLYCGNERSNTTKSARRVGNVESADNALILAADIPYAQDLTILNLILLDVNDNAPVFAQPKQSTVLGYPANQISFELFPAYLTQVRAIDSDADLNAHIRYGIRPNKHFGIDTTSGVIYPKAHALQAEESTELLVSATDRNGAANGLSTKLKLSVRRLSADYYSLLTLAGVERKSFEEMLAELSAKTNYSILIVKEATLTNKQPQAALQGITSKSNRQETDLQIIQQAWIYAFAGKSPVIFEELQNKLVSLTNVSRHIKAESYATVGLTSNRSHEASADIGAYIVAVTILSLICTACISFLIWRFYVNNYTQSSASKSTSNGSITATSSQIPIKDTYMPHTTEGDSAAESNDEAALKKAQERRRSQVTFNELVNRIQIEVDEANKHD